MPNKSTTKVFIKKAKKKHGHFYSYEDVRYINNYTKVVIGCEEHGNFEQTPNNHLTGKGCPLCGSNTRINKVTLHNDEFLERAKMVHGDTYDYSITEYKKMKDKIKVICKTHGQFEQTPDNHVNGHGCPHCKLSIGELQIKELLDDRNLKYTQQKRFEDCRHKYPLSFDFYLPRYNTCIEFQGEQHFKSVTFWGGEDGLKDRLIKDNIKEVYCKKNNIKLITIDFNEDIKPTLINRLFTSHYL